MLYNSSEVSWENDVKRLGFLLSLVVSVICVRGVEASNWKYITSDKSGRTKYYIDFNNLRRVKNVVSFWLMTETTNPEYSEDTHVSLYKGKRNDRNKLYRQYYA